MEYYIGDFKHIFDRYCKTDLIKYIEDFIKPFREQVNKNLDSVISYAPETYSKSDGELNTAIGNLMADAVYEESNPVSNSRTGKDIDFVLLNHTRPLGLEPRTSGFGDLRSTN